LKRKDLRFAIDFILFSSPEKPPVLERGNSFENDENERRG
jgi:hypothetical protein